MNKIKGWFLCHFYYYISHFAYLFIDRILPDSKGEPSSLFEWGWNIYQNCMLKSSSLNDKYKLNVWKPESYDK